MLYVIVGIIGGAVGFVVGLLIMVIVGLRGANRSSNAGYGGKIEKIKINPEYTVNTASSVDGAGSLGGFKKQ